MRYQKELTKRLYQAIREEKPSLSLIEARCGKESIAYGLLANRLASDFLADKAFIVANDDRPWYNGIDVKRAIVRLQVQRF